MLEIQYMKRTEFVLWFAALTLLERVAGFAFEPCVPDCLICCVAIFWASRAHQIVLNLEVYCMTISPLPNLNAGRELIHCIKDFLNIFWKLNFGHEHFSIMKFRIIA